MKICVQWVDTMFVARIEYWEHIFGVERQLLQSMIIANESIEAIQKALKFRFHQRFHSFEYIFKSGTIEDTITKREWKIDSFGKKVIP